MGNCLWCAGEGPQPSILAVYSKHTSFPGAYLLSKCLSSFRLSWQNKVWELNQQSSIYFCRFAEQQITETTRWPSDHGFTDCVGFDSHYHCTHFNWEQGFEGGIKGRKSIGLDFLGGSSIDGHRASQPNCEGCLWRPIQAGGAWCKKWQECSVYPKNWQMGCLVGFPRQLLDEALWHGGELNNYQIYAIP